MLLVRWIGDIYLNGEQMACPEKWPVTGWTEEVPLPEGKIWWNVQTGTDTQNVIQNVTDHETDQMCTYFQGIIFVERFVQTCRMPSSSANYSDENLILCIYASCSIRWFTTFILQMNEMHYISKHV
jgi:hypothetical protein